MPTAATPNRRLRIALTRRAGAGLAVTAAIISGLAIFLNQYAVKQAPNSAAYTTAKNLVAALLLAVIAATLTSGGISGSVRAVTRRSLVALLIVGVFGGGVAFALFFEGLRHATSTNAAFIQKSLIIWVAIAAMPLLRERIGIGHVIAVALLVVGQVFLIGGAGSIAHAGSGELMILMATLIWSAEIIVVRVLLRSLPSQLLGASRMVIGCVFLLAYLLASGQAHGLVTMGPSGWGWALITGVVLTLYVTTWFAALARAPAIDVTAILVLGAFITALLDAVAGHASLASHALGLTLIVAGAAAMTLLTVRRRSLRALS